MESDETIYRNIELLKNTYRDWEIERAIRRILLHKYRMLPKFGEDVSKDVIKELKGK